MAIVWLDLRVKDLDRAQEFYRRQWRPLAWCIGSAVVVSLTR